MKNVSLTTQDGDFISHLRDACERIHDLAQPGWTAASGNSSSTNDEEKENEEKENVSDFSAKLRSLTNKTLQDEKEQREAEEKTRQHKHQRDLDAALEKDWAFVSTFLTNAETAAKSGKTSFKMDVFAEDAVNPLRNPHFSEAIVKKLERDGFECGIKDFQKIPISPDGKRHYDILCPGGAVNDTQEVSVPGNLDLELYLYW